MVFYRCQHQQVFGNSRCQNEPKWAVNEDRQIPTGVEKELTTIHVKEGCSLNPDKCGKLITIEEAVDLTAPWLQNPTVTETITPKEKGTTENKKAKSKAVKKLEGEIAQKSLF